MSENKEESWDWLCRLAKVLKCLPSTYVSGNEHIIKAAEKLQSQLTASQAEAEKLTKRNKFLETSAKNDYQNRLGDKELIDSMHVELTAKSKTIADLEAKIQKCGHGHTYYANSHEYPCPWCQCADLEVNMSKAIKNYEIEILERREAEAKLDIKNDCPLENPSEGIMSRECSVMRKRDELAIDNKRLTEGILSDHDPKVGFATYPIDMADAMEAKLEKYKGVVKKIKKDAKYAIFHKCGGWLYYETILKYIEALTPVVKPDGYGKPGLALGVQPKPDVGECETPNDILSHPDEDRTWDDTGKCPDYPQCGGTHIDTCTQKAIYTCPDTGKCKMCDDERFVYDPTGNGSVGGEFTSLINPSEICDPARCEDEGDCHGKQKETCLWWKPCPACTETKK